MYGTSQASLRLWETDVPWEASRRWVWASIVIAGVVVATCRAITPFSWGLWAEDGAVFLGDAWRGDGALLASYAGYLHVVPRLLALGLSPLPVAWAAAGTTFAAIAIAAACSYFCVRRLQTVLTRNWTRCTLAGFIVASPAALGEVVGNLANLHWVLTLAAVLALWMPSRLARSGWRDYSGGLVCLSASLSDPLAALALVPVAVVGADSAIRSPRGTSGQLLRDLRTGFDRVALPLTALTVGLAAQVVTTLASPRPARGWPEAMDLAYLWTAYSGPRTLLGHPLAALIAGFGPDFVVLLLAIGLVVAVWAAAIVVLTKHRFWSLAPVVLLPSLISLALNWNPGLLDIRFPHGTARYAYIGATLTMLSALALSQVPRGAASRVLGRLCAAVMLLGLCASVIYDVSRSSAVLAWRDSLETVETACPEAGEVQVPIEPQGWEAPVPCSLLPPQD